MKLKTFRLHGPFISDEDVLSERFIDKCAEMFSVMSEFIGTLNDIVMPDDDNDSFEEEGDDEEETEE